MGRSESLIHHFDVVGWTRHGLEFCVKCAPAADRREAFELHRFEAEGPCAQCGTALEITTETVR